MLTPIHIDDSVSSLTAILLEDSYYELLLMERDIIDGITVLKPTGFIFILDIYRLPIYNVEDRYIDSLYKERR